MVDPSATLETAQAIASNPITFAVAMTKLVKQLGVENHGSLVALSGIFGGFAVVGLMYVPNIWANVASLLVGVIASGMYGVTLDVGSAVGMRKK